MAEFIDDLYVVYRRHRVCVFKDRLMKNIHREGKSCKLDGGGVTIGVQKKLHSVRVHSWETKSDFEDLWVMLHYSSGAKKIKDGYLRRPFTFAGQIGISKCFLIGSMT